MRQTLVTAGVIYDEQGRVLIAQRRPGVHAESLWEFPGGKLEVGEHPEAGLARELQEELGIFVGDLRLFDVVSHIYEDAQSHVVLLVYTGRIQSGTPQAVECQAYAWEYPEGLQRYQYSAADLAIVQRLQSTHTKSELGVTLP